MARPLRLEFEEALYHITARGNRRERIFASDADRARFLEIVAHSLPRFGVEVHAYVLLPNHFHLLVRTRRANLSRWMLRRDPVPAVAPCLPCLHYPGGTFIRRDYTARGQLKAVGWDDDDNIWWYKAVNYTYLRDGKVDLQDNANGATLSDFEYDGRGFMKSVQHKASSGPSLASRTYTRDLRDRITVVEKGPSGGINPMENGRGDRYAYDPEGQLTDGWYNATNPAGNFQNWTRRDHFSYDALGNRQGGSNNLASRNAGLSAISFFRRDNGLNQYTHWWPAGTDYVIYYDDNFQGSNVPGNGNLAAEGWITASYNALNQPIAMWSFTYQGTPNYVWFGHDPLGRCVKRWVGPLLDGNYPPPSTNPATYFYYEGWNLLEEGTSAWGAGRVYLHGNRVDEIVASYHTATGEYAFHHYDARGHCTLLTDRNGEILEQYEYDAFGQPYFYTAGGSPMTVNGQPGSAFGNRFLFTGREWLSDLRLYDFRNRMYQPELGRFLQPDPKHFAAGDYNLYRYCHNDPINKSDPLGLLEFEIRGDEQFKAKIVAHIAKIDSKPAGLAYLNELRASPFQMIIVPGEKNTTQALNFDSMNGKGSGSTFGINPDLTESAKDSTGSLQRPGFIGTAHELAGHGIENARGQGLPRVLDNTVDKIPRSEKGAVGRENEIRKEHAIPERVEFYKRP